MKHEQRKALYRTERDSLEGPHEEAEIQRKALRREKNLAFSKDTCLEKEKVWLNVTPRKVGVGLKRRWEKVKGGWAGDKLGRDPLRKWRPRICLDFAFAWRGRHQYSDQLSNGNRAPCVAFTAVGTKGEEDQMARSSV